MAPIVAGLAKTAASNFSSGLGASAGSGLVGQITGAINAARNYRYQKKLMELQQGYILAQMDKQLEIQKGYFDYQNAYNTPSQVVQRGLQAGINPATSIGGYSPTLTSSASSGGSSPSGGSGYSSSPSGQAGNPVAYAQEQALNASVDRDLANAELARAQANDINSKNLGHDFYKFTGELENWLRSLQGVSEAQKAQLFYSQSIFFRAKSDAVMIEANANAAEKYANADRLYQDYLINKRYYDDYQQREMEAVIAAKTAEAALSEALAGEASARTDLLSEQVKQAEITTRDLAKWFEVNWETSYDVPIYNEKGKVIEVKKMTGADIQGLMLASRAGQQQLEQYIQRWSLRSEKNRLGYDLVRSSSEIVLQGAVDLAKSAVNPLSSLSSTTGQRTNSSDTAYGHWTDTFDRDGNLTGRTHTYGSSTGRVSDTSYSHTKNSR